MYDFSLVQTLRLAAALFAVLVPSIGWAQTAPQKTLRFMPYVPTGQFVAPTAFRKNLDGIIVAPVAFLWNVEKK